MTPLQLFKKANAEDMLLNSLIGAGAGGLGLGAASYFGAKDKKNRGRKALQNAALGAALGGTAGAGASAMKELFERATSPSSKANQILMGATAGGRELESAPFNKAHPIEYLLGRAGTMGLDTAALGGAGLGLASHKLSRNAGKSIADTVIAEMLDASDNQMPVRPMEEPKQFVDLVTKAKSKVNSLDAESGKGKGSLLTKLFGNSKPSLDATLEKAYAASVNPQLSPAGAQRVKDNLRASAEQLMAGMPGGGKPYQSSIPGVSKLVEFLDPSSDTRAANAVEALSSVKPKLKSYAAAGLKGGLAGLAAGAAGNIGTNLYMNAKYPQEQLAYWNALAKGE